MLQYLFRLCIGRASHSRNVPFIVVFNFSQFKSSLVPKFICSISKVKKLWLFLCPSTFRLTQRLHWFFFIKIFVWHVIKGIECLQSSQMSIDLHLPSNHRSFWATTDKYYHVIRSLTFTIHDKENYKTKD